MTATAKLFKTGRSQAVRLPKDFRFEGDEVRIRREGTAVILEPLSSDWQWLETLNRDIDDDFVQSASERPKQQQKRPGLDVFE